MNDDRDRPLCIVLLTPSASRAGGGVSVAVRDLARLLLGQPGFTVEVIALADAPLQPGEAGEWSDVAVSRHAVIGPRSYGFSPGLLLAVLKARPDVIHVHGVWQFHCLAALAANLLRGTPIVVTPHGMFERWILANSRRLKAAVRLLYLDRFLRRTSCFHILTEKEGDDVHHMIAGAPCRLIPNAVHRPPPPPGKPAWWRASLEGRDIYVFLGRLHRKKGCTELCDAWERLCRADPPFRDKSALVFCGPPDGIPGLAARVRGLDEHFGNALMAGPQFGDDKQRSLGAATFLCLSSHSEGLPIAVLEAWAAGVPTIMTPACNLPIGFHRGAAIATTTQPEDIAASLKAASDLTDTERSAMARAGRAIIAETFAPDIVRDAWTRLFSDTVTNHIGSMSIDKHGLIG